MSFVVKSKLVTVLSLFLFCIGYCSIFANYKFIIVTYKNPLVEARSTKLLLLIYFVARIPFSFCLVDILRSIGHCLIRTLLAVPGSSSLIQNLYTV